MTEPCGRSCGYCRGPASLSRKTDRMAKTAETLTPTRADFEALLAESFGAGASAEGSVVKGGDDFEVYLERIENALGEAVLSRDKARREEAWTRLEQSSANNERVDGVIFGRVKGGFTVDLGGAVAFLPVSEVDIRPMRDVRALL